MEKDRTPKKALNKAFLKIKPNRSQIETFKGNLIKLIGKIDEIEREENQKTHVRDFLRDTYYIDNHEINTKNTIDLVIHHGKDNKSDVGVIIEAKRPSKVSEMITLNDLNRKALHEILLYYFRERITEKNINIKHLIVTNVYEWFIFDETTFERFFHQNKKLVKQFLDFESSNKSTDVFYKEIAEPFIAEIKNEIDFTYIDIRDYEKPLRNKEKNDDNKLIVLYKLLSPEHLLKLPFINDSNSLDKRFYSELLHIIGLTETKEGGKKIIQRNKIGERNSGSLIENAIIEIESLDKISRLENKSTIGETQQERLFNVALELSITWINRILFLKLLEGQLVSYHKGDKNYQFLNYEKINDYDELNSLFFKVLAVKQNERIEDVKNDFMNVPYLNSSLFEPTEMEQSTIVISNLRDERAIPIYSQTVLKDLTGKKRSGEINPLNYLFEFLNAYDFASEGKEEIQEESKTLINASVLGLIFEKINGYKDGSFFTPGFITMYMCRETIRKAVIQKFNDTKGWNCEDIHSLYNKIDNLTEANQIINTLKICDPAVGSGHFLVSALNEIIAIKHDLKILVDREGKRLKEYHFEVVNDELMITDEEGDFFEYNPTNKESHRIQETLFHEKQVIIENCLFGVDINPNSVKICRLRLWIELLKNAYYKNETELETLPNIDINIKCGNSLVSRFALDADLKQALKKSSNKWTIDNYRIAVDTYRNAKSKEEKREMERLINDIKTNFRSEIAQNDPKVKKLFKLNGELYQLSTQGQLFELSAKEKNDLRKKADQITEEIKKIESEIEEIKSNKIYENAFEWRFEFPEVLDENGDFVGFDVVIGNPPYGVSIKGKEREHLINYISKVPDYEIYYWFIDRSFNILKDHGISSYIIPNSILFNVFAQNYRLGLFEKWNISEILDCTEFNIFEDATVRNIIFRFCKHDSNRLLGYKPTNNVSSFDELVKRELVVIDKKNAENINQNWGLIFKLDKTTIDLIGKIKDNKTNLLKLFPETSQGLIAYDKYQGQDFDIIKNRAYHHYSNPDNKFKLWLYGEDITRYSLIWNGKEYIDYCDGIANPRDPKFFKGKRILIREITNPSIFATITVEELYNDPSIIIIKESNNTYSIECLLAILNSKLATFFHFNASPKATKGAFPKILVYDVNNFPLPSTIDETSIKKIEILVDQILEAKKTNPENDTSDLETQIDQLVYELYGLTEEEIKIVEGVK